MNGKKRLADNPVLAAFKLVPVFVFSLFVIFSFIAKAGIAYASALPTAVSVTYYDGVYTRGWTWRTDKTATEGYVQVVEKKEGMTKANFDDWDNGEIVDTAVASSVSLQPSAIGDTTPQYVWKANYNFTSAANGKAYLYRVGSDKGWSAVGEQKIDDGRDGVYLIHTTDPQGSSENDFNVWKNTVEKAYQTHPKAQTLINTGDFVEVGHNVAQWNWALNLPQATFMDNVMTPVSGNHDENDNYFATHFNVAAPSGQAGDGTNFSQSSYGLFYSYDIGNAHITVLNTNEYRAMLQGLSAGQLAWLKDDLAAANANAKIEWKIVAQHAPLVSTGPHGAGNNASGNYLEYIRDQLFPIMAEYGVDLVLQGHDHVYARSNPLTVSGENNRSPVTGFDTESQTYFGEERQYAVEPGGTTYVIINRAGTKAYALEPQNNLPEFLKNESGVIATNPLTGQYTSVQTGTQMFGAISIKDSALLYESYTVSGNTVTLYDYVGVVNDSGNVPAAAPVITAQPQNAAVVSGSNVSLSVTASVSDGGTLSYQWYRNTINGNTGGTLISGAVNANYSPDASAGGTSYYYAIVTNTLTGLKGTKTAYRISDAAEVAVGARIEAAAIGGVISPVAGQKPDTYINDGEGFTAALTWEGNPSKFNYGTVYTAVIRLTAKTNYVFDGYNDNASVEGFKVNGIAPVWVRNTGVALVLTVSFPATEAKEGTNGGTTDGGGSGCGGSSPSALFPFILPLIGVALFIMRKK